MFIRTPRLFLRPAWSEDAAVLGQTLADQEIQHKLAGSPWLEAMADPDLYLTPARDTRDARLLIFRRTESAPQLIGATGVGRAIGRHEFGIWLTRGARKHGFALEAGRAVLNLANQGLHLWGISAAAPRSPEAERLMARLGFQLPAVGAPFAVQGCAAPSRLAA